jgi:short subunit dehydrogenase-like uncharacterized protein
MIYGAYGVIGKSIVNELIQFAPSLIEKGLVVLAGRNAEKLYQVQQSNPILDKNIVARAFEVESAKEEQLQDIQVLLNCAGPFVDTAKWMIRHCLKHGT